MGLILSSFISISVLVFSGFYVYFKAKNPTKNPFDTSFYWITSFLSTPVLYVGMIFIWLFISSSYENKIFIEDDWAKNRETRYEYVQDLVENHKLMGITRSELKAKLGEADQEDDSIMTFYIGYSPDHFFNMDPDWLEVVLRDGKVKEVRVRE
jgi:hypothetical protein